MSYHYTTMVLVQGVVTTYCRGGQMGANCGSIRISIGSWQSSDNLQYYHAKEFEGYRSRTTP